MNAAPAIGIQTNLLATTGAPGAANTAPALGDSSGGEAFGWGAILKALGLTTQGFMPKTAAFSESSFGHDPKAMGDLEVPLDQAGSNASATSKPPARGDRAYGTRTVVAVVTPKAIGRPWNSGDDSFRGKKLRNHLDEPAKQKNETAPVGMTSPVDVPVTSPGASQPVQLAADARYVGTHSSSTTSQHQERGAGPDGSAVHESSPVALKSKEAIDPAGADAESRTEVQVILPETSGAPSAAQRIRENAMPAEISSGQKAKESGDTPATIDFAAHANVNATFPGAAAGADASIPAVHGDSRKNVQVSTSISDRMAKSTSKTVTDSVYLERRSEVNQPAPDSTPPLREIGGIANAAEGPVNAAHHAGRDAADPFATLDAERAAPPPTWIHAGAHHAEAGYLDPALGWIGVRADAMANGVHASLVPASGQAAQVLGSHLAGLNTYLSEHHGDSATVTIAAPDDGRGGMDAYSGGDRQSSRQEQARGREEESLSAARLPAHTIVGASPPSSVRVSGGGGRYISVVA